MFWRYLWTVLIFLTTSNGLEVKQFKLERYLMDCLRSLSFNICLVRKCSVLLINPVLVVVLKMTYLTDKLCNDDESEATRPNKRS